MKPSKEILILIVIFDLIVYFLIGDSKIKLWSFFYFLNQFSLIILLAKYKYDFRFNNFLILFCIINIIRIFTKFVLEIDLDSFYKFIFAYVYIRFIFKSFKIEK